MTLPTGLPPVLAGDWAYILNGSDGNVEYRDIDGNLTDERPEVAEVVECWFDSNGEDGEVGSELNFYGVVRFVDGRWGYGEAWNDYTGWGCQDGVEWRIAADPVALYEKGLTDEGRAHLAWKP